MKPPFTPKALPKVPMTTSGSVPVWSPVPRPAGPYAPIPCESSTIVTRPPGNFSRYGATTAAMRSIGAKSPRMLKMPSKMTITRSMPAGTARRHSSRWSMSLCR